jgi:hypothetical protein
VTAVPLCEGQPRSPGRSLRPLHATLDIIKSLVQLFRRDPRGAKRGNTPTTVRGRLHRVLPTTMMVSRVARYTNTRKMSALVKQLQIPTHLQPHTHTLHPPARLQRVLAGHCASIIATRPYLDTPVQCLRPGCGTTCCDDLSCHSGHHRRRPRPEQLHTAA